MYVSSKSRAHFNMLLEKGLIVIFYFSLEKVDITLARADITLERVAITIGRADTSP